MPVPHTNGSTREQRLIYPFSRLLHRLLRVPAIPTQSSFHPSYILEQHIVNRHTVAEPRLRNHCSAAEVLFSLGQRDLACTHRNLRHNPQSHFQMNNKKRAHNMWAIQHIIRQPSPRENSTWETKQNMGSYHHHNPQIRVEYSVACTVIWNHPGLSTNSSALEPAAATHGHRNVAKGKKSGKCETPEVDLYFTKSTARPYPPGNAPLNLLQTGNLGEQMPAEAAPACAT